MVDRNSKRITRGRPRDTQLDAAILDAVSGLLNEVGYVNLAVEQVAKRAGASKAAIYRRWPGRQYLVLAELQRRLGQLPDVDTGCTICDLNESLGLFADAYRCMGTDLFAPLLSECSDDPALKKTFMVTLFDPPREVVSATLRRAVDRGDLRRDIDLSFTVDALASFVYYRLLFGHAAVTAVEIENAVESLLSGLATDYADLHRRAANHEHGIAEVLDAENQ